MCRNARRVSQLCEALGIHQSAKSGRFPAPEFPHLEHELLVDELEAAGVPPDGGAPPDGAWILPEEF